MRCHIVRGFAKNRPLRRRAGRGKKMEVDSRVVSAGEKADNCRNPTIKRQPGRRADVKCRLGHRAALAPMHRLLARAVTDAVGFFTVLAALVFSVFSGGREVDSRVTSAPRAGIRTSNSSAKEEDHVYSHDYCSATTVAKSPAVNTVAVSVGPFWLGCPGPLILIKKTRLISRR